jgi:nitrate reductase NapD
MNVSSIIVKVLPENFDEVRESLKNTGLCEIHFAEQDKGIIIVTVEGEGVGEEIEKVRVLENIPKVISADMHLSYCEDELNEMQKDFDFNKTVDDINSDKPIEEIVYNGSLKGRF